MATKPFFKKKDKPVSKKSNEEREFITWGAAWMGELKKSDLPYLSVKISAEDLELVMAYAEEHEGQVNFMMFPNTNPRAGMNDPDYYLFPPLDEKE